MTMAPRAFLFDMDGTIVDNMAFHTDSWLSFFARRGQALDADEFFRATAGRQGGEIMRSYLGEHLSDDEVALLNHEKAVATRDALAAIPGVEVLTPRFFNEFAVRLPKPAAEVVDQLASHHLLAGVPYSRLAPDACMDDVLLVAATETTLDHDIKFLATVLGKVLAS